MAERLGINQKVVGSIPGRLGQGTSPYFVFENVPVLTVSHSAK